MTNAPEWNPGDGLALMRRPFADNQISKLCKPTKKDNPPGTCKDCGRWHKLPSVQLSYVGHAALTDRLLDCDPNWTWEPVALGPNGLPVLDGDGGLWIKLTVCGVTRFGYGDAQGKQGGDAMKERIGDALRNAGMRFGAALELWHKGDLHATDQEPEETSPFEQKEVSAPQEAFMSKTGQVKASAAVINAFREVFNKSGKTEAQLVDILRARHSATSLAELTTTEIGELVKWASSTEPLETTLKDSVKAVSKPVETKMETLPTRTLIQNPEVHNGFERVLVRVQEITARKTKVKPFNPYLILECFNDQSPGNFDVFSWDTKINEHLFGAKGKLCIFEIERNSKGISLKHLLEVDQIKFENDRPVLDYDSVVGNRGQL